MLKTGDLSTSGCNASNVLRINFDEYSPVVCLSIFQQHLGIQITSWHADENDYSLIWIFLFLNKETSAGNTSGSVCLIIAIFMEIRLKTRFTRVSTCGLVCPHCDSVYELRRYWYSPGHVSVTKSWKINNVFETITDLYKDYFMCRIKTQLVDWSCYHRHRILCNVNYRYYPLHFSASSRCVSKSQT